jgi:hypothetical protein
MDRRIICLIVAALLSITAQGWAGGADAGRTQAALAQVFDGLDASEVPTGILYDRVVPLSGIHEFDGAESSPSASLRRWRQMYFEISRASLNAPSWPDFAEVMELARQRSDGGVIPVSFMSFRYDRIRPDALEDGTLAVRDGRLVRLGGDPYTTHRVHAVTALKDYTHRGESVVFSFDDRLYFSNDSQKPVSIAVDFDDGLGYREVHLGAEEVIRYAETGDKTIRTRASYPDGRVLHGSFQFDVGHLQTPDPDDTLSVTAAIPYEGQFGTGEAYVYLADGHTVITNPVVVVEGFDLDNTMNWDELYQLLNQENLIETLRARGCDAVVLNFTEATDYVQKNSFVVVELIEQVKALLDPYHDIALVGASMGALCGRYALAYMENHDIEHRVRTYVSFDGPHGGANIPLGVQYWLDLFSDLSEDAAFLLSRLDTPAARQMLVYHHTTPPGTTGESDPLRASLLADFAAVGDYPAGPRTVAVANGSGYQAGQGFSPGDQIIDYEFSNIFVSITGNAWAVPDMTSSTIFNGSVRIFFPTGQLTVTVSGTSPYDNAPGGRRDSMAQMDATEAPQGDIVALHTHHCFVPTVSALDLATSDLFYDVAGDPDIYSLTPFDAVYYPSENQDHVTITAESAQWFISELEWGVTGVAPGAAAPAFIMSAPIPNPARGETTISFSTARRGPVEIALYDVRGRRVATLLDDENLAPGSAVVPVDTGALPSGIYFVRLSTPGGSTARKLVVLR